MSVKHSILALLYQWPRHGYDIKIKFEEMVHNQWPLNVGQIYTTLDRLVRDGYVEPMDEESSDRKKYTITEKGKEELQKWLLEPVGRSLLKDEFYFKLLCAKEIDFKNQEEMISKQKTIILQNMIQMRKLLNQLNPEKDNPMIILIEGSMLHLEADMKWLELIESN